MRMPINVQDLSCGCLHMRMPSPAHAYTGAGSSSSGIHTYMHACIHTCIHACIHTYTHRCWIFLEQHAAAGGPNADMQLLLYNMDAHQVVRKLLQLPVVAEPANGEELGRTLTLALTLTPHPSPHPHPKTQPITLTLTL